MRVSNDAGLPRRARLRKEREQLGRVVARGLRLLRIQRRVKQAKLAYRMGVAAEIVSNIELCKTRVSMVDAIVWGRALDMDLVPMFEWMLIYVEMYYERIDKRRGRRLSSRNT